MAIAVLDIDGTLVDTNYHHAIAWYRAFREHGIVLPVWRIHRQSEWAATSSSAARPTRRRRSEHGDEIRDAETEALLGADQRGRDDGRARELIEQLKQRGHTVVLASSAKEDEVDHYLDLLDAASSPTPGRRRPTSRRPSPSPIWSRGARAPAARATTRSWSATPRGTFRRLAGAGVRTIAVLTGGFSVDELRDAGALDVFESVRELCERLDRTPLA